MKALRSLLPGIGALREFPETPDPGESEEEVEEVVDVSGPNLMTLEFDVEDISPPTPPPRPPPTPNQLDRFQPVRPRIF